MIKIIIIFFKFIKRFVKNLFFKKEIKVIEQHKSPFSYLDLISISKGKNYN